MLIIRLFELGKMESIVNKTTDIDKLIKNARRYEYLDGLVDITYGFLILALGLVCWFIFSTVGLHWYITALIQNREITILGIVLLYASLLLLISGSQRIVQRIRQSPDWRTNGYVKSLRWNIRWPVQLIAGGVSISIIISAFVLMVKGVITQDMVLRSLVTSISIATGIIFLGLGIDLKLKRYITVGVCGILLSTIILIMELPFSTSWLYFGIAWMIVLVFSGIWALRQYQITSKGSTND
jgi:hypothetical protein